jgi:glutamine amidotransferase-like uncharacterized protein
MTRPDVLAVAVVALAAVSPLGAAGCRRSPRISLASAPAAPVLLFDGTGTSRDDVEAVAAVLKGSHLAYANIDTAEIEEISPELLRAHRLLIVPGGNFEVIGKSWTPAAATKVRTAVQGGLGYLGICAGALIAGQSIYNGLNLTSGVRFRFYAAVNRGIHKAAVPIAGPGAPALDQYWEDGPQLSGWGAVVASYPDGTPAVVEGSSGSGWVVLSGVHPEAPESWRRGLSFRTPASVDNAYAATLVRAALDRTSLRALADADR